MGLYHFREEDAERFAHERHIRTKRSRTELKFETCPYCNGTGGDKWTFSIGLTNGAFNCKRASCAVTGNMIDLAKDFGFSLGTEADEYYNPQRRFKSLRNYPRPTVKDQAVEYFAGRGISESVVRRYSIGARKDNPKILVMPFYDDEGQMQFIKYRNTDPQEGQSKEWCESGCRPILFGMDQCDPERDKTLIMTEGQIDSLSVVEAYDGQISAVSVPTGAKGFTWVPYCWDFLGKFETLIVFGDHEHDQITLLDEMEKRFHGAVKHVRPEDYQGCKDANELLVKYGRDAVRQAIENAVFAPIPEIIEFASVERLSEKDNEKISTGLRPLDSIIGGFYMGRLYLLTGKRGNGKSTMGLQFGVEALDYGYNVMIYSGEMDSKTVKNWLDRQIAGKLNITGRKERTSDFINYYVDDEVNTKIEEWYRGRAFLYCNEIVSEGREMSKLLDVTKKAITLYGCRMIILDNLMSAILKDMTDEQTDIFQKQALFVHKLVTMAKAYGVVIMLVVHPRKGNPRMFDNDDISGSSNIADQADVIMNYASPPEDEKDSIDRILMVTKNRISGSLDKGGIPLWYEESSKRITAAKGLFDKIYGWDTKAANFVDVDASDIPFD